MTSADLPAPVADAAAETDCYHCGLPIPPDTQHYVRIDGLRRRMCCFGWEADAQSIIDSGLVDYYRHRDAMPETRRVAMPDVLEGISLFYHHDFQEILRA